MYTPLLTDQWYQVCNEEVATPVNQFFTHMFLKCETSVDAVKGLDMVKAEGA